MRTRCSIACIIPPVLLEELARRGSPEERDAALRTLSLDASLRIARVHNALVRAPVNRATVRQSVTAGQPQRTIFDCHGLEPPSDPDQVRAEGDPPSDDVAVNEAYDGLGDTYAFFWDQYRRDSIDDQGMPLHGWVHYGRDYDNAFWDGEEMVFGDGKIFDRFTKSLDVIGHELTHGVTEHEAGLQYLNQSGALNESVSDVFGSLVKQFKLGQDADQADWLIGADLVKPGFPGKALRSMIEPGTAWDGDNQPAHMDDYVQTMSDNGGVHINSGIPNKAFAELALRLGGPAWERAGRIWYETLRDPQVRANATFREFAGRTVGGGAAAPRRRQRGGQRRRGVLDRRRGRRAADGGRARADRVRAQRRLREHPAARGRLGRRARPAGAGGARRAARARAGRGGGAGRRARPLPVRRDRGRAAGAATTCDSASASSTTTCAP